MPSTLARTHRDEIARLRRQVQRGVLRAWNDLPEVTQSTMDEWLDRVVPLVAAGRAVAVSETDGYFSAYLQAVGEDAPPLGLNPDDFRRPQPDERVYARPFVHTFTKRSEGMEPRAAAQFGGQIAATLANTDLTLASRGAAHRWTSTDQRITGYRRVIGPEACGFCVTVSTRMYKRGDLLPIHDNCGCSVEPVVRDRTGDVPLSFEARAERLGHTDFAINQRQRELMREGDWAAARRVAEENVATRVHGELGPVLVNPNHQFTGPEDVAV